jgi:hypothetical protein
LIFKRFYNRDKYKNCQEAVIMAKKFDFAGSMLNDVSLVGNKINNEKKY